MKGFLALCPIAPFGRRSVTSSTNRGKPFGTLSVVSGGGGVKVHKVDKMTLNLTLSPHVTVRVLQLKFHCHVCGDHGNSVFYSSATVS